MFSVLKPNKDKFPHATSYKHQNYDCYVDLTEISLIFFKKRRFARDTRSRWAGGSYPSNHFSLKNKVVPKQKKHNVRDTHLLNGIATRIKQYVFSQ